MFEFSIETTFVKWEEVIVISIFIIAVVGSYLKLYPTMAPYEYGYRVFVLTYCILMMAGNRTKAYTEAVLTRLMLIALGAGVCLFINICIYPIWAGEDLHALVAKNFKDLATSLEGCVDGYLLCVEYERIPSKILTYQPSDEPLYSGYRSVVESTTRENALLGFTIWEPPHGRYKILNYPWRNYVKVFRSELQRVGEEGAKVLREIGNKIENMEKLNADVILKELHKAAENLQKKIDQRSYLLVKSERWEIVGSHRQELSNLEKFSNEDTTDVELHISFKSHNETVLNMRSMLTLMSNLPSNEYGIGDLRKLIRWPSCFSLEGESILRYDEVKAYESASSLSLATFASLLIELVARLHNLVDAFEELSEKAEFKDPSTCQTTGKTNAGLWTRLVRFLKFKK